MRVTNEITDFLGYPRTPVQMTALPDMRKQSDAVSTEWIERFQGDPGRIDLPKPD